MNLLPLVLISGGLPQDIQQLWTMKTWGIVVAAILLWLSFLLLGLSARNYEKVLRKATEWQFLVIAPSGILLYAIIQAGLLVLQGKYRLVGGIGYIGYGLFLISSIITLIGIFRFYRVISGRRKKRFGRKQ